MNKLLSKCSNLKEKKTKKLAHVLKSIIICLLEFSILMCLNSREEYVTLVLLFF